MKMAIAIVDEVHGCGMVSEQAELDTKLGTASTWNGTRTVVNYFRARQRVLSPLPNFQVSRRHLGAMAFRNCGRPCVPLRRQRMHS